LIRTLTIRLLAAAGAALVTLHILQSTLGLGGPGLDGFLADWLTPLVFLGSGAATIIAAGGTRERLAWTLLGSGLVVYACGSAYYRFVLADTVPGFPSAADAMWLALYPFAFAAIALLVRARFLRLNGAVWLDVAIGGTVVAAVAAAVVFEPVFDVTVAGGMANAARLAYPIGDLLPIGFVAVVWALSGRRIDRTWALLGAGFAMLAVADSTYVVQAANNGWAPGTWIDLVYAVGTMALAAAACAAGRRGTVDTQPADTGVTVPVASALTAVALATYEVVATLNPLATTLSRLTLFAVVVRFGLTLSWLSRQRVRLAALAQSDPLTALANHRTLHEELERERVRAAALGKPLSVVVLDMDHFKAFNDTYGHQEGDAALQAIARELVDRVDGYGLVGRLGGEEFALVLPDTGPDGAYEIAERCRKALARLPLHGAGLSCSAGTASYPADDAQGNRLLEFADGALYWAKRSGRGRTRRYDPREVVLLSSREQQEQVRAVLAQPNGLTPVFQPIVELTTGRIAGYEALTRFLNIEPVRAPDLWFAQARRCGLGPALEARAIEVALAVPGRAPGSFLSINMSTAALMSAEVAAVLPDDLSDIVIELTEDELFSSGQALDEELAALRARGARIAVDDAGAGYAGLQQLIRVKPEMVKVDRALVSGLQHDDSKAAMLEALSRFAISTGAAVCAEGVEEVAELRLLARFDVTYGQGYVLARPGPAWPTIAIATAAEAAAKIDAGMRVGRTLADDDTGRVTLGMVTEALARTRTREDLAAAAELIARLVHADDAVVSRALPAARCVQTLTLHEWARPLERFSYDDYPTTEYVLREQVLGQLIVGDLAGDRAEIDLLQASGFEAALMVPVVFRAESVGLLEVYRRSARPWTMAEIDQVRVLAHHLGIVTIDVGTDLDDDGSIDPLTAPSRVQL
jgi:diguanylate cyclase (GGDEF)-like protein